MTVSFSNEKIVIIGSGPCGLGAAWRLQELGYENFMVFERESYPGGLAASFVDEAGFTWDIGGHVQFSHYSYFDALMDSLFSRDEWCIHQRESWVWIAGRFVPYPFQNNIKYLPKDLLWQCLEGLIDAQKGGLPPKNFKEWICAVFGEGIAQIFMLPYNFKIWAHAPEKMSFDWIGERVSVIDLKRVAKNVILDLPDFSWGPNNTFRFPLSGGTGEIWRRLSGRLDKKRLAFNFELSGVDVRQKTLIFKDGRKESYDRLISTIPLDKLLVLSDWNGYKEINADLLHSSVHIFGVGIRGDTPPHLRTKCWMYFPEGDAPFYRATVFSNYSPNHVPDPKKFWSLMLEVSESGEKPVDHASIREEVIKGLLNTKLVRSREDIVDVWYHFESYGYPTPSLNRDNSLRVLRDLEAQGIFSRGRFGAWKYEVANQDHTFMQGVEAVNKILLGEEEQTVFNPAKVNVKK